MIDKRLAVTVGVGLLFILTVIGIRIGYRPVEVAAKPGDYRRIVSLAPSLTETLFALGLGDRVVGVTRYCTYPSETAKLPKLGGFTDVNKEAIVRLNPDLIVTFPEHDEALALARSIRVPVLAVKHESLDDILESIRTIGRVCRTSGKADALIIDVVTRLNRIRTTAGRLARPRVLVVIGRERGTGTVRDVTIVGKDGLYDRMLDIIGAKNACEQSTPAYPVLSAEAILRINPDIVVELAPEVAGDGARLSADTIRSDWRSLAGLAAVKNDRVHVLSEDYVTSPGPRIIDAVELLARRIHPSVFVPPAGEEKREKPHD